jgi:hypothetical protein
MPGFEKADVLVSGMIWIREFISSEGNAEGNVAHMAGVVGHLIKSVKRLAISQPTNVKDEPNTHN